MTPTAPSDPAPTTTTLPRGPAVFTHQGVGLAVVLVHGLPGSHRDFRWLEPALDGVATVRVDLPGFGDTPWATAPSGRLARRARFVSDVADALGLERFVVVGHSFGGPVATAVAAADHRVVGLGLLASVGTRAHAGLRSFPVAPRWLELALRTRVGRDRLMPGLRQAYLKAGFPRSTPDEAYIRTIRCIAGTSLRAHAANVGRIRVPALVAWTRDDHLVEPDISQELAARLPPGPRLEFEDGGHNLQKTQAVEIGAALSTWARDLAR